MSSLDRSFLLLDRDGVLCADRPDFVKSPTELEPLSGVAEALGLLTAAGVRTAVITNQSCIGRGLVTRTEVDEINAALSTQLSVCGGRIERFFLCPHAPDAGCMCRKPSPGLILEARAAFDFDPTRTWLVGDDLRDIEAARRAGCRPALVLTGKGTRNLRLAHGVPKFVDLADFCAFLLAGSHPSLGES